MMFPTWLNPVFQQLSFPSPQTEREFRRLYFQNTKRQSQLAILLGTFLFLVFVVSDPWIVPEQASILFWIRFAVMLPLGTLIFVFSWTHWYERTFQVTLAVTGFVAAGGIYAILWVTSGLGNTLYAMAIVLLIIWSFVFSGLRFLPALSITVVYLFGYEWLIMVANPIPLYLIVHQNFFVVSTLVISGFAGYKIEVYRRDDFAQTQLIEHERQQNEILLLNILPEQIAEELKQLRGTIAQHHPSATILFADIVGFTHWSDGKSPIAIVETLNTVFSEFDDLVERYRLEKIKTIGDAYMVAGGVPMPLKNSADVVAQFALDMLKVVKRFQESNQFPLDIRIGIHSGPVVAGVIGTKKIMFDIWGDSVNTASRMESHGVAGKIHTTETVVRQLSDGFQTEERGFLEVKGKGPMRTFFINGGL